MKRMLVPHSNGWTGTALGAPWVGKTAELSRRVTETDIDAFARMTGDRNPIHFDADIAAATRFGGIVVQGGVTSGLLNALVATHLPGPGSVFMEVGWRFLRAVAPGETLTARAEVLSVRDDKPICRLSTTVLNAGGEVVLEGHAVTYTLPLPGKP